MSRKAQLTLGLLILLLLLIATASAGPRLLDTFGLGIKGPTLPEYQPYPAWDKQDNHIMVLQCQRGFYWSDIDKGESICTLPTGEISAGDVISNCQGQVTLTHTPSNAVIFSDYFTPHNIQSDPNKPDDPNKSEPEKPEEKPTIVITKPQKNIFYFRNLNIKSSDLTRIIGYIDIEVSIKNPSDIQIKEVEFCIDDQIRHTDDSAPYSWRWNEKIRGDKTIKVMAISETNEELASAMLPVSILNFKL